METKPIPLDGYQPESMFDIDPEEENIQKLRDRKMQQEVENGVKQRINQVIQNNNSNIKEYIHK
jgi:hypothetical protein